MVVEEEELNGPDDNAILTMDITEMKENDWRVIV